MNHVSAHGSRSGWRTAGASAHLVVCLLAAVVAGVAVAPVYGWGVAALAAWLVGAGVFVMWVWTALRPLPAPHMARIAAREDAIRPLRDLVLLGLSAGTVVTVALVIFRAHENSPPKTVLGVACIAASWLLLHTVLTLRYARLYYTEPHGGVDFNRPNDPTFRDFAYLRLHGRYDVSGFRHDNFQAGHPRHGAMARRHVVRLRHVDHRGHYQRHRRPQPLTAADPTGSAASCWTASPTRTAPPIRVPTHSSPVLEPGSAEDLR